MVVLPLVVALLAAALVAGPVLRSLRAAGWERENHRGRSIAVPGGLVVIVAVALALVPLALLDALASQRTLGPGVVAVALYVLGVALLGLVDDVVGSASDPATPRGWRGHGRALLAGRASTGALKAVGSLGLALLALADERLGIEPGAGPYLLAVVVLVLSTNLFNLLDLRPGRSLKALVLLGAGLTLGTLDLDPLWLLGLFLAPLVVLLPLDLRERAMLGDTGSNAVGAVAGLWLVLALAPTGQIVALVVIALVTVYGEFRSISSLVERTPFLRQLDSIGRLHA